MQILLETNASLDNFLELIGVLLIFAFVLLITWFATRYMANFQRAKFSNNNMQIIENVQVGNNKYISLVEVGEVYLVISVGKDEIHFLTKLTKDELPEVHKLTQGEEGQTESFQELLNKVKGKIPKK